MKKIYVKQNYLILQAFIQKLPVTLLDGSNLILNYVNDSFIKIFFYIDWIVKDFRVPTDSLY